MVTEVLTALSLIIVSYAYDWSFYLCESAFKAFGYN